MYGKVANDLSIDMPEPIIKDSWSWEISHSNVEW